MKPEFDDILSSLPEKPPRSRLEPYRVLIEELRRRRRTFREIAVVLAGNYGLQITGSGIHDFLRRRSFLAANRKTPQSAGGATAKVDSVRERVEQLKERKPEREAIGTFEFDPGEPLTLTSRQKITRQ